MIQASVKIVSPAAKREEILDVLRRLVGPTEVSKGCFGCQILCDFDDEDAITYVVRWEDQEQLVEHFRSERFRRIMPYIELSLRPPEIEIDAMEIVGGIDFLVSAIGSAPR